MYNLKLMKKKFVTEKLEKKLKFIRSISILLIIVGIIKLFFEDYSEFNSFASIGSLFDSLVFIILGIIIFLSISKRMTLVSGSYIWFEEDKMSFKSRKLEKKFESFSEINSVDIKLKTIEIYDSNENQLTFYMDDYVDYSDKKEIKLIFLEIQKEIITMHK